jgi:hypothetical protein
MQVTRDTIGWTTGPVAVMNLSVVNRDGLEIERTNSHETGDVHAQLSWIRTPSVVSIYSTIRTEIMLGLHCIEAIETQALSALDDLEIAVLRSHYNCAPHPAE